MIRRDYLMRLIEQFAEAIGKILKLKKEKDYKKSLSAINQTYLLKEEGEVYEAQKELDLSCKRYSKSLDIFLRGTLSEGEIKMDTSSYDLKRVVQKLGEGNLPSDVKSRLTRYYEKIDKNK